MAAFQMYYLTYLASFLLMVCVSYSDSVLVYVRVRDSYPQNAWVSHYCPSGTIYSRHVCGTGARSWRGRRSVQYGPYSTNKYLTGRGHCSCCCDCNSVTVECRVIKMTTTTTVAPSTTTTETPITAKAVHLDCSDQGMTASFNESYFPADILNITIPYCKNEKYEVEGNTIHCSFGKCAKRITEGNESISQENVVDVAVGYEDQNHVIQRSVLYSYTLRCTFNRRVLVNTDVSVEVKTVKKDFTSEKHTNFSANIDIYKTNKFATVAKSPHIVETADDIYVQISSSNNTYFRFVTTKCYATPNRDANNPERYLFFYNKCKLDLTFEELHCESTNQYRFKIHSFTFIRLNKAIFFHCELLVCKKNSSSPNCSQECAISHRRRRSVSTEDKEDEKITVSSDQIQWQEADELEDEIR